MLQHLFTLDDGTTSLQRQLQRKLIEAILNGYFAAGSRMPSSRKLAEQLGVSRNTVVAAYEQLSDEGYLVSRERSGIFVSTHVFDEHAESTKPECIKDDQLNWQAACNPFSIESSAPPYPDNWDDYRYPFIDGQYDQSLFPLNQWRECSRISLNVDEIKSWARDSGYEDDASLIHEIRTKVLPRRGIQAQPDEILVTLGSQQALYLVSRLLMNTSTLLTMEEPGYQGIRQLAQHNLCPIRFASIEKDGIALDDVSPQTQLLYVTPSHQVPTAVTMSKEKREALVARANKDDFIVIEDDYESEANFISNPNPALKSLDSQGRVIYISSFSKALAPGLRLGFMVASPVLIKRARQLRALMLRHPPANNQRIMALFLSLGYYDMTMRRLYQAINERWQELREALNHYLGPYIVTSETMGGSTCWVKGPPGLNSQKFAAAAAQKGILIEPVDRFYGGQEKPDSFFRLGVRSLPKEKIRPGIEELAKLIDDIRADGDPSFGCHLKGEKLKRFLSGVSFSGHTVFGDPYCITLHPDGSMKGVEGHNNEKVDEGTWWLKDNVWYRQWQQWSYGELLGFDIYITENRIHWVRDGKLVDAANYTKP
ncbi:aminotransferase class I/II-fold pyridoxal phosphate-dependent enzyme [Alteromonas sp. 345S023]|uniref:Aminotransferase class I/II-fold pyridoxal phosphate-dependent enzyme n=1 Tax=Alteromonas profundi TaxID=2696062 RepID=A0A7X5RL59_9ALTE|nr:PLP-dependent aminotransferase family protein [Alteromonas profundi]NDV91349.1 aminotransferase class I/II-fold pyridoxal phosphate-dependent enzyme [Alteromonas profundi]